MPIINVELLEGRSPEVLAGLIRELTTAAAHALDRPESAVRVLVHEVPAHLWGVGGVAAAAATDVGAVVRGPNEPG